MIWDRLHHIPFLKDLQKTYPEEGHLLPERVLLQRLQVEELLPLLQAQLRERLSAVLQLFREPLLLPELWAHKRL